MDTEEKKISGEFKMNLYDVNKQLVNQLTALNDEDLNERKEIIKNYLIEQGNQFYMLLCKDISYYTLFDTTDETGPRAADEVVECIKCVGEIKSIEENEDGAIEIWICASPKGPMVMYLFPYDVGVIKCGL